MIFEHETGDVKTSNPDYRAIATVLDKEIRELIGQTPELSNRPLYPGARLWELSDENNNKAEGLDIDSVLDDFDKNGLIPTNLHGMHMSWADDDMREQYILSCYVRFGSDIHAQISGPNRIVVDGVGATLDRIAERAKSAGDPKSSKALNRKNVKRPKFEWLTRHKGQYIAATVALAVTVIGAGIAYMLGWN